MIALVADAGARSGLGHLARATAVGCALRALGAPVRPLGFELDAPRELDGLRWEPLRGDVPPRAVVDSYLLGEVPGALLRWDDGEGAEAAIVVRGELALAALRRDLWGLAPRAVRDEVRRTLVTVGGGDPAGNAATLAAEVRAAVDGEVLLVRGPYATFAVPDGVQVLDPQPSLVPLLREADLVVSAAGQGALEAAATGAPTVAVPVVANQRRNARALLAAGAAVVCDPARVGPAVRELAADAARRRELAATAQAAVDGHGALRLARALLDAAV